MDWRFILGDMMVAAPHIAIWVIALVLSSIIVKNGVTKLGRFLVIGSALMLLGTIISMPNTVVLNYAIENDFNPGTVIRIITWSADLIFLPGIICLFYTVWKKFREGIAEKRSFK